MRKPHRSNPISILENLEPRTLFSESASAQPVLVSTTGSGASTVYNYNITLKDTGTTAIGTFWFGWVPGEDFMKSMPTAVTDPTGWQHQITGGSPGDGFAIQWTTTGAGMSAGQSLSGFKFSSADSPTLLAGNSAAHPPTPTETSFVYIGAPFNDPGFQFVGAPPTTGTNALLVVTAPAAQTAIAGVSKSFALGSFKATGATAPYTVDVNWGDGSADTKFVAAGPGPITAQSHTFAKAAKDTVSITITDAAKHTSNKATFPVTVTQSITGMVFNDTNANGKLDTGEKGLATVKVYIDAKKTGSFVSTDINVPTTSTGTFTIPNLASGTYRIREVVPSGFTEVAPVAKFFDVTLTGTGAKGLLFADAPATASISGEVFGDTNADGKIDDNELGLGLWSVYIDTNNDGKLETTEKVLTTDINGRFTFTGLTAGKYVIRVVPVTGAVATKPTGGVLTITLAAGQKSTGDLFGERAVS